MSALSFSDVRFVRDILSKKKTKTLRPLFCTLKGKTVSELYEKCRLASKRGWNVLDDTMNLPTADGWNGKRTGKINTVEVIKKPKYKVGDEVNCFYKMAAGHPKGSWFCKKCGKKVVYYPEQDAYVCPTHCGVSCASLHASENPDRMRRSLGMFPKLFARVRITEVFEAEMVIAKGRGLLIPYKDGVKGCGSDDLEYLIAKRDGFKDKNEMFTWIDKAYDLSTSKRFAVYRFEVVK